MWIELGLMAVIPYVGWNVTKLSVLQAKQAATDEAISRIDKNLADIKAGQEALIYRLIHTRPHDQR